MYSIKCIYIRTLRLDRFLLYIYIKHAALRQFVYDGFNVHFGWTH